MWKSCALLAVLAVWGSEAAGLELAADGRARAAIIVPAAPTRAETFAAEELRAYLGLIAGAAFAVHAADAVPADAPAGRLYVGALPENQPWLERLEREPGVAKKYERYAVVVTPGAAHFAAPTSQGLLYAAWDFLESLGVAWLFPTRNGTYVPSAATLAAKTRTTFHAPALEFRSSADSVGYGQPWFADENHQGPQAVQAVEEQDVNAAHLFAMRMRINTNLALEPRDAYRLLGAGHSYGVYLPMERYGAAHPEWYAFVNGRRQQPGDALWQLCFTNRDGAKAFAANALAEIKTFRDQGVPAERLLLFVSPNDYEVYCECPACAELVDDEPSGGPSSRVLHYANLVAEEVHRVEPDVKVAYYVYHRYGRVPTKTVPARGVYPFITGWTANESLAVNNAWSKMDEARNPVFRRVFDWMAEHADGVFVYPYYAHWDVIGPYPVVTQMDAEIKAMAKYPNFLGMNSESHQHWGTQTLNLWLYPRLMADPGLDAWKEIRTFCQKAFGPAGEEILAHYRKLQAHMDGLGYIVGAGIEAAALLPRERMAEGDKTAASVRKKLDRMDPATRWRTEMWLDGWDVTRKYAEVAHILKSGTSPDLVPRAQALLAELDAFMQTERGRFVVEARTARGSALPGMGLGAFSGAFAVNLDAVPPGEHKQWMPLLEGGPLKLYATLDRCYSGLWGFAARAGHTGVTTITLRPAEGRAFTRAAFDLQLHRPGVGVSVVGDDGRETPLRAGGEAGRTGPLAVPPEHLGARPIRLRLSCPNPSARDTLFISGFGYDLRVE